MLYNSVQKGHYWQLEKSKNKNTIINWKYCYVKDKLFENQSKFSIKYLIRSWRQTIKTNKTKQKKTVLVSLFVTGMLTPKVILLLNSISLKLVPLLFSLCDDFLNPCSNNTRSLPKTSRQKLALRYFYLSLRWVYFFFLFLLPCFLYSSRSAGYILLYGVYLAPLHQHVVAWVSLTPWFKLVSPPTTFLLDIDKKIPFYMPRKLGRGLL